VVSRGHPTPPSGSHPEDAARSGPGRSGDGANSADPALERVLETVARLFSLQVARSSLALRRAALWLAVGTLALVGGATLAAASVWVLVEALARAGSALFGGAPWLGAALAGAAGLGFLVLAMRLGFGYVERSMLERLRRQAEQRARESRP